MVNYTINATNASAVDRDFFIFAEKPHVSNSGHVFQSVFMSEFVPSGGKCSFVFNSEIYGVCGETCLQSDVALPQIDTSTEIHLGTAESEGTTLGVTRDTHGKHSFKEPYPTPDAAEGCFNIQTASDLGPRDFIFIGMGSKVGGNGDVRATAITQARPITTSSFCPHMGAYYISTGSFPPGTIIDTHCLGLKMGIQLSEVQTQAAVTYQRNGTWSPS